MSVTAVMVIIEAPTVWRCCAGCVREPRCKSIEPHSVPVPAAYVAAFTRLPLCQALQNQGLELKVTFNSEPKKLRQLNLVLSFLR